MPIRLTLVCVMASLWQGGAVVPQGSDLSVSEQVCSRSGDPNLARSLETIRDKYDVPAMAGAIVTSRGLATAAAVGVRKRGTRIPVTLNDHWHLGSITKAMTATLMARLVEQGKLTWETTVAEVFPELEGQIDSDLRDVTVLHLLCHRAGLPKDLNLDEYRGTDAPAERLRAVRRETWESSERQPAMTYLYSNLGYIIVGAMIERVTGVSWEENMAGHVFGPLKMGQAGFGGVGTPGQIDQPWGHTTDGDPVDRNGPSVDNPPVMGPAGRVHCTLQDWAKFVADQLRGSRGEPSMLKASSYQALHRPPFKGGYALGWIRTERDWAGGAALTHAGSNTMNYANVWIAPQRDFAVLVCINQGGRTAFKASDAAASALIRYHTDRLTIRD